MGRVHILGSGSKGNAAIVESSQGALLIDCGLNKKTFLERCASLGVDPLTVAGIVITHEHTDHIGGLGVCLRGLAKMGITPAVYATAQTQAASLVFAEVEKVCELVTIKRGDTVSIAGMSVTSFATSHDAAEPLGLRIEGGENDSFGELSATAATVAGSRVKRGMTESERGMTESERGMTEGTRENHFTIGYMTDTGYFTAEANEALRGCDLLALEVNHDPKMLKNGPYPYSVKQRIASDKGHLSNSQATEALEALLCDKLRNVVGMHLSENNNEPQLALAALQNALRNACHPAEVRIARQLLPLSIEV
jgi:phosphoribosyl 1,2-cyclic phosphodiesterase